ncbi:MAG: hypothetical protein R3C39_11755 [Dehalococcoidia bacterium]
MSDVAVPNELAMRPGVRRVQTFLSWLRGDHPTEDEVAEQFAPSGFVSDTPAATLQRLGRLREQLGEFEVAAWEEPLPGLIDLELESSNGRTSRLAARLARDTDERIMRTTFLPKPPGFIVRAPREDEVAQLAAIDAETPILVGEVAIVYERDPSDYFADERLMGDGADFGVMEQDGRVVGVCCLATRDVMIGGVRRRAAAYTRARVAPAVQGGGARGHMQFFGFFNETRRECDFSYAIIAMGNEAMLRAGTRTGTDGVPQRAVLDTSTGAASSMGRSGTAQDGAHIARLLNAAHEGEEFFLPYTAQSLEARLSMAPDLYSWSSFRVSDRAVIGVRPHTFRVHRREGDGPESLDTRALCLDYGFEPDAEAEFEELLRGVLHELAENGDTDLSLFTSEPSRGYELVSGMAKRMEPYLVQLPRRDGDSGPRSVYVDQIYF